MELVHGFGFAGALGEAGLPCGALAPALASFNIGVELGQLAIVAERSPGLVYPASGAILLLGLWWLPDRTLLA